MEARYGLWLNEMKWHWNRARSRGLARVAISRVGRRALALARRPGRAARRAPRGARIARRARGLAGRVARVPRRGACLLATPVLKLKYHIQYRSSLYQYSVRLYIPLALRYKYITMCGVCVYVRHLSTVHSDSLSVRPMFSVLVSVGCSFPLRSACQLSMRPPPGDDARRSSSALAPSCPKQGRRSPPC